MYLLRLHFTTVASTLMYYMLLSCRVRKGATSTTWGRIYDPRSVAASRRLPHSPTPGHGPLLVLGVGHGDRAGEEGPETCLYALLRIFPPWFA